MRYPLVDGSGNFGSVNGDPAAAMRYTEARLSPYGELMLEGVEKLSETVPNFDGSDVEPVTLSSYFPNLLLNPQTGIAVGLATKFAPHYAKDVYTALIKSIEAEVKGKEFTLDDIVAIVKAPDFPTGAEIINGGEMKKIYSEGRGSVVLRAKYRIEKDSIIYYEIPYKITPKSILEEIAKLNLSDIRDVRDESSLDNGLRLVVELRKGADSGYIVRKLFKDTKLQSNYAINMTAIAFGRPMAHINFKSLFDYYMDNLKNTHRKSKEIIKAEYISKLFTVNTMLKAIGLIEEIIRIVRNSDNPVDDMQSELGFTKEEAEYIYNIKISSLSKANKLDLDAKKADYLNIISEIDVLLNNHEAFLNDLAKKLKDIRDSKLFKKDERKTDILYLNVSNDFDEKSVVKKEPVMVTYSNMGFIRVTRSEEYKISSRNSVGNKLKLRENEFIIQSLSLTTHDDLLLVSSKGRAYILPVYKVPIGNRNASGKSINTFISLDDGEEIIFFKPVAENVNDDDSIVFFTNEGYIKRTNLLDILSARNFKSGRLAIGLDEDDKIVSVDIAPVNSDVAIFTDKGRGIVFNLDDDGKGGSSVRVTGRNARGVMAMKLSAGEHVVFGCLLNSQGILLVSEKGYGKYISRDNIIFKKRKQSPNKFIPNIKECGNIASAISYEDNMNVFIITAHGQNVLVRPETFSELSRNAKGVRMIRMKDADDYVVALSAVAEFSEDTVVDTEVFLEDEASLFSDAEKV